MSRVQATTTKPVNVPQLASEMAGASIGGPDPSQWYTSNPKTIWADNVTQQTLDNAIAAHTADQAWGWDLDPLYLLVPVGVCLPFAGPRAPAGWLLCDGASVLRSNYPVLFSIIGTAWGSVDGTHFNVPDLRDKFVLGASPTHPRGQSGGAFGHTHTGPAGHSNHVVTQPASHTDVPAHTHNEQAQGGTTASTTGTHLMTSAATGGSLRTAGSPTLGSIPAGVASQPHSGAAVDAHSAHGATGGADPPWVSMPRIIKATP